MDNIELINLAIEARKNATSPTEYYVGAAILTENGNVYTGCNIGSKDGLFNICAERTVIVKMISEGECSIKKIAVVGGMNDKFILTTPCGICRQMLHNINPEAEVICGFYQEGELKYNTFLVKELLPHGYEM